MGAQRRDVVGNPEVAMKYPAALFLASALWMTLSVPSGAADDLRVCASVKVSAERAIAACKRVIAANPGNLPVAIRLGTLIENTKQFAGCADTFGKVIDTIVRAEKQHWPIFYFRGVCYDRNKQWEKAEIDLKKALEVNPDEPHVMNYLGYSWIERGLNTDVAMQMLRRAVELNPNDAHTLDSLGWAYYGTGNSEKALDLIEHAVKMKPDEPTLNDHLGDVYEKLGRKDEARTQWLRARNLKPDSEELAKIDAKIKSLPAQQISSPNESVPLKADDGSPSRPTAVQLAQQDEAAALNAKIVELYRAGKFSEAIPMAQRALAIRENALGPSHPYVAQSLNNLAGLYHSQGRYADAEPLFKRSLAIRENALGHRSD
jgi:Flp pilus assembly protein TadD